MYLEILRALYIELNEFRTGSWARVLIQFMSLMKDTSDQQFT